MLSGSSRQNSAEVCWVSVCTGHPARLAYSCIRLGFCSNTEYNIYLKGILLTHTTF